MLLCDLTCVMREGLVFFKWNDLCVKTNVNIVRIYSIYNFLFVVGFLCFVIFRYLISNMEL